MPILNFCDGGKFYWSEKLHLASLQSIASNSLSISKFRFHFETKIRKREGLQIKVAANIDCTEFKIIQKKKRKLTL